MASPSALIITLSGGGGTVTVNLTAGLTNLLCGLLLGFFFCRLLLGSFLLGFFRGYLLLRCLLLRGLLF